MLNAHSQKKQMNTSKKIRFIAECVACRWQMRNMRKENWQKHFVLRAHNLRSERSVLIAFVSAKHYVNSEIETNYELYENRGTENRDNMPTFAQNKNKSAFILLFLVFLAIFKLFVSKFRQTILQQTHCCCLSTSSKKSLKSPPTSFDWNSTEQLSWAAQLTQKWRWCHPRVKRCNDKCQSCSIDWNRLQISRGKNCNSLHTSE